MLAIEEQIVQVVVLEQPNRMPVSFTSVSGCASLHMSHALIEEFPDIGLNEERRFRRLVWYIDEKRLGYESVIDQPYAAKT